MIPTVTATVIPTVTPTAAPMGTTYTLGTTIVTNGTFDTDTAWTKNGGWLIDFSDNNLAAFLFPLGADTSLTQTLTTEDATEYRVEVQVKGVAGPGLTVEVGGVVVISGMTSPGIYSGFVTVSGISNDIEVIALAGATASVDNVKVQKVTR